MNGLAVKDVNFNGATLRAAQDVNNITWVGVSWICNGIGFSKSKKDTQIQKIQSDSLLRGGCLKFQAGVFDENNDTLALKLDYLPAWLFKINITPKMQKDDPELADRLLEYQLKAKDVLAEAFLVEKKEEIVPVAQNTQTIQLQMPTYDDQFAELNRKIDKMYSDMGKLAKIILEGSKTIAIPEKKINNNISVGTIEEKFWKQKIYGMIGNLLQKSNKFSDVKEVMKYIYDYMRKNYGIVWEQESREYMEGNDCVTRPNTIDIVYNNETYRSIFESVLTDLIGNSSQIKSDQIITTDEIIRPLITKFHDTSNAGMCTYRIVYNHMDKNNKICWSNRTSRYRNKYGTTNATKKDVINASATLMKMFKESVDELLKEEK